MPIFNVHKATKLKVTWGTPARAVIQERITGKFTKDEIREKAQQKSNSLKQLGYDGMIQVSIKYPRGFSNGNWTTVGNNVSLYDIYDDEYEPDDFSEMCFYYVKHAPGLGADDKNNDCVYNCLKKVLGHKWKETPESFKFFLGLGRTDKVPVEKMPEVETLIPKSYKINLSGDHTYESTRNCTLEINLVAKDGHCTLGDKRLKVAGVSYTSKPTMMYYYNSEKTIANGYNGTEHLLIDREQITKWRNDFVNAPYMLVAVDKQRFNKKDFDIEQYFKQYKVGSVLLNKESKGLIDLQKTGTFKRTALNLFSYQNKVTPDPIQADESEFLEHSKFGAIIYGTEYSGPAHKADFVSMYPSTMAHPQMYFPIKRGTFQKLTVREFMEYSHVYGIYRCIITSTIDKRLFRINPQNFYTHIDIQTALRLDYDIQLIEDGKPNALTWERNQLVTGNQYFGEFVKTVFDLKHRKIPFAKEILNILWGSLCEIKKMSQVIKPDSPEFNVGDSRKILIIKQLNDTDILIQYVSTFSIYATAHARIAPFLLARGRYLISKAITPFVNDVVFVHTDGWIQKSKPNIKYGTNLGDIRDEGHCEHFVIKNAGNKTGIFVL
jgi:hypothetical protein